ncbi:hypothetical protein ABPG75_011638 [Micractinium tetrahymenae]
MAEPGEVQLPAALAPLPHASPEDSVAAAAAQMVADVFAQLGMQELQDAAAAVTRKTTAAEAEQQAGGSRVAAVAPEAGPDDAILVDTAPTEHAAAHAAAPSLPDEVLRHMVEEDALPQEPDTSRQAEAACAAAEMGAGAAELEQVLLEPAAGAEPARPAEQLATVSPAEAGEEPAEGEPDPAEELSAAAASEGETVLQQEPSAAAAAAVEGQEQGSRGLEAEDELAAPLETSPAAAAAAGICEEQEPLLQADVAPAEGGMPASPAGLEEPTSEQLEEAATGGTGSGPAAEVDGAVVEDGLESPLVLDYAAEVPASPLLPAAALLEAAAADVSTSPVPLPGAEPSAELAAEPEAVAELDAAAEPEQEAAAELDAAAEPEQEAAAELEAAAEPEQEAAAELEAAAEPEQEADIEAASEEGRAGEAEAEPEDGAAQAQPWAAAEAEAAEAEAAEAEAAEAEAAEAAAAEAEVGQEHDVLVGGASAWLLGAADLPTGSDDVAATDAYSLALNREVSAKLLAVLSEQQLHHQQQQQLGGQVEEASRAASGAASPGEVPALVAGGAVVEPASFEAGALPEFGLPPAQALPVLLPDGLASGGISGPSAGAAAPLLNWSPTGAKKGSPHLRKAVAPVVRSPALAAATPASVSGAGPHSPTHRQRMAPLPAHSPTAIARAAGAGTTLSKSASSGRAMPAAANPGSHGILAGAAGRQRRLSKPSMHEILGSAGQARPRPGRHLSAGSAGSRPPAGTLPTAPMLAGGVPMQLAGGGMAPGPFPAMGDAPPGALLHWGARPAAPAAPAMPLASPAGWFVPMPVAVGSQGGYLVQPGMMPGPAGMYVPYGQPGQGAGTAGMDAEMDQAEQDGPPDGPGGPAAEGHGAAGAPAAPPQGDEQHAGQEQQLGFAAAASGEDGGEPPADGAFPPAEGAHQQEQYDVAASWPPYEGAKLPPLYQEHWSGAGLIPAVHGASSFSVAPIQCGRSAQYPHSWAAPSGPTSPAWGAGPAGHLGAFWAGQPGMAAPAQQWGMSAAAGYGPAQGPSEQQQQAAAMHFFIQQQQAAAAMAQFQYAQQQAASYGHAQQYGGQQYGAQQDYAGDGMHADGPTFYREPPPPLPVAIDARGRPFKVFHGVAARSLRRPERYQGDGRPAWSR